jgi:hypothetical protein
MRTSKLNKSYNDTKNSILKSNADKLENARKELAYLEMREATGTANKFTLIEMLNKQHSTDSFNEQIL